jgi:hypothetical protein
MADSQRSLDLARRAKDPQVLLPALAVATRVSLELGRTEESEATGLELTRMAAEYRGGANTNWALIVSTVASRVAGLVEVIRAQLQADLDNPWAAAALAVLDERYEVAAGILDQMGDVADQAYARLLASEQHVVAGRQAEANAELSPALAFYRSVGATRYIRQAEALLAASA